MRERDFKQDKKKGIKFMNFKPKYNPEKHHRRSIRLMYYDYSQVGFYFITICTHNREDIFGKIENGKMSLNEFGNIVHECWLQPP